MILGYFTCVAIFLFTIFVAREIWNRSRRFPPSPMAVPIIGHLHLLGPLIHRSFADLSSRYGPLMYLRLGSVPCVVASTPELAKELLKTHDLTFSSRKHSIAIDHLTYNSSFAFAPVGPYWKFVRKVSTTELLGARMLNQLHPIRTEELKQFLGNINTKSKAREVVNVTEALMSLSNNIISRMMLSIRSSGTGGQAEVARILVREVTQIFGEFNVSDFIWFCKKFDFQGFRRKADDIHERYDQFLEKIITDREQARAENRRSDGDKREPKDFLDVAFDVMEEDNLEIKLTRDHIKALVLDFFTAATDTTAISIEWALAELINHSSILEKARDEIDKVIGKDRIVTESDIPNLPYVQAIAKEALRLHPPIPVLARKSIEERKISGYTIPKNAVVFINIWSMVRNPDYWKDPFEFKPERFLLDGEAGDMDVKGQHFQLLPFGSGRRSCPGITLAMQELQTTLAAMIQCFDWKVAIDSDGEWIEVVGNVNGILDMTERHGLTAPRALDLVCFPKIRVSDNLLDS